MSASGEFKINKAGMDKLKPELDKQFSAGIQIPRGGTETEAIKSVTSQLKKMGVTPNDSEVLKMVREHRK